MNAPDDTSPQAPPPPRSPRGSSVGTGKAASQSQMADPNIDGHVPRDTAMRRRRLQMARCLRLIASLRDEADEMRAEISSLEFIIGAQADAIEALRRQINDPKK